MSYNIAFPKGVSVTDAWAFDIISTVLLDAAGAPLKMALLKEKIGDVVGGSFDAGIMQPVFSVTTQNANVADKERFVKTIEETLDSFVNNKLNEKALKAALNSYEFKLREGDFRGMSKGLIYAMNAFNTWLYDDEDAFSSFEFTSTCSLPNNANDIFSNIFLGPPTLVIPIASVSINTAART